MHTKQGEVKKDVKMCKTTFFRLPFSQKGSLHVKNQHKIDINAEMSKYINSLVVKVGVKS